MTAQNSRPDSVGQVPGESGHAAEGVNAERVAPSFTVQLLVKDPDAFQELCWELGERRRDWFEFGEYATVNLEVEVREGAPVITAAEFAKR